MPILSMQPTAIIYIQAIDFAKNQNGLSNQEKMLLNRLCL